jgi:hypothetical protein
MLLDEDDRILRRVGRRDRLEATMAELPGRPFYLLSAPPGPGPELDSPHVAALVHDPALVVREVYRSPDGRHWLAAVSSRSSHARARVDQ